MAYEFKIHIYKYMQICMCEYTVRRMKRQPRIEKVFTNHIMDLYPKYMFYLCVCVCVYIYTEHTHIEDI